MPIRVRGLSLAFLLVLVLTGFASADVPQDLSVHLYEYCPLDLNICNVTPYQGTPGNPAAGHVDFGPIDQSWSFRFLTANPLTWSCDRHCNNYNAAFGMGGVFTMDGPQGLTLTGQITSGSAWQNLDLSWGASLNFTGQWSNGMQAYGDILDMVTDQNGPYASLDVYSVPEPTGLTMLGTGALILGRWWRRSFLKT